MIGATLRDVKAEVASGRFREDLWYRIGTFELALPPLRERGDDVVLLARAFADGFAKEPGVGARTIGRSAVSALRGHAWPGNVRELRLVLLRAALAGDGEVITGADLRRVLDVPRPEGSLEERLVALLTSAGSASMGQITAALKVPRTTAWRALSTLAAAGTVVADGPGKGRRYRLADDAEVPGRSEELLALARREGRVTRQRAVAELGLTERTATRLLGELVEQGCLAATGRGRGAGYVIAAPPA